ncbi:dihydrolipoyl dehydrogenase [Soehngenia saccharolytica]|nr:dihydrolipoyl dehydrogenase [Soehngenia saccharolytica]
MRVGVLGSGPGGYVCAIRLAQLGAEVTVIEDKDIGGVCLNKGCIPTKVLLHSTEIYDLLIKDSLSLGLKIDNIKLDFELLNVRKDLVVNQLVEGVKTLFNKNNVELVNGRGKLINNREIEITTPQGLKIMQFDKIVIATGSRPMLIPIEGNRLDGVLTSDDLLKIDYIPDSMLIVGGGVIGVEFANIYSNLGTKVTIVEMLPSLIANMDYEIASYLEENLIDKDVDIYKNAKVVSISKNGKGLKTEIITEDIQTYISSDVVLMATGRRPNIEDIGLEQSGVKFNKKGIETDELFKTNIDNIYAIGDCTDGIQLAHQASSAGIVVADTICGGNFHIDFNTIPFCVYTKPELAGVGITEQDAKKNKIDYKVGRFPLYGNSKAVITGDVSGIVKIIIDSNTKEVLGMHIAGLNATELIEIGGLAVRLEATANELVSMIFAHPTVSESIHEASMDVIDKAIHNVY